MENKNTIFQELQSLSPFLADKRPAHPYKVPAGYFDSFPERVLFQVDRPVVQASQSMPMDVPVGYFDGLAASILSKIKESEAGMLDHGSELLASIGKNTPYEVPAGYFEQTAHGLESIFWNESAPTVLTIIGKKNPYSTPEGYFNQFPSSVLKRTRTAKEPAPVYPISFVRKVYRYAVAAVVVGIISVAGLMYFKNQSSPNKVASSSSFNINSISIDELQNYISGHEFFDTENDIIATNDDLDAADLKEFLSDMPVETLQQFVQQYDDPNTN